jgi:glycosyltransferase involved in cell wall biosynthesis
MSPLISLIIPARNEAALIAQTIAAALESADDLQAGRSADLPAAELIVVDNQSSDGTAAIVQQAGRDPRVRLVPCARLGSAAARNAGAEAALAPVLAFADADTLLPRAALRQIVAHCAGPYLAGITGLAPRDGGLRARLWWGFWSHVRRLPLPRAKAMPALMFCTRGAFAQYGPFDERVSIGEEWPILAGIYRAQPARFIYDRSIVARSSSRRMELQRFGYTRTLARYAWAILHHSGRVGYPDTVRHTTDTMREATYDDAPRRMPLGDRLWRRAAAPAARRDVRADALPGDGG